MTTRVMRLLLVGGLLAIALGSCAAPVAPATAPQARGCGDVEQGLCAEAIAQALQQAPQLAAWPLVVAGHRDANASARRGGDLVILVAFVPTDSDVPGAAWLATALGPAVGSGPHAWTIAPWGGGPFPPHFLAFVRAALSAR
jgi:hypothetical protein